LAGRRIAEFGSQQLQVLSAEAVIGQPPVDAAVAGSHLLEEHGHRFGPHPVQCGRLAVDVPGVGRGPAQPGHDGLGAIPRRGVIVDHILRTDSGHGKRERYHHAGPVLARRAVDQRRALGMRDAAQRGHDLIGTVFQVIQVVPADRIIRVARPVISGLGQQCFGDHVSVGSDFGKHGVVSMTYSRDGIQRRRAL